MPIQLAGRTAQLARFCLVGLTCFVVNILTLALLCEVMGVHYVVAYIIVFFVGSALGYWLNKHFTFSLRSPMDHASMVRYVIVNCVMLGLSTVALHILVEWLHVWYLAAVTLIAGASTPASFLAHRVVTYRVAS